MNNNTASNLLSLDVNTSIWEKTFMVSPLILVGSKEKGNGFDLAPKHLAMPLSWSNHYGFVCTPRHATYHNIIREKVFTISFPTTAQVVASSLAASPRCADDSKPDLLALPTFPATKVEGVLVEGAYLFLECVLEKIIDGFGENSLITGKIVAAHVDENYLRNADQDDQQLLTSFPLLAFLYPGRFAETNNTIAFPFPAGFKR